MINQLITALSKEVGLSAEEIADTIWLALQMGEAEPISSDFPLSQEDKNSKKTSPKLQPKTSDSKETARNQSTEEQKAGIYPQTQHQTSTGSDLSFKVPDAPSLREPLTLARALRPLMRRLPSGTTLVLDEAATIQRIADKGLWLPVLRPTLEPWLDLELVVDESISMQIWRHTIRDLERLLKNYGIFRDVRVWGLIADEQEQVQIRRGIGATAKNQPLRSPAELIDPSGRRLVLVVSDCVSSGWRNGKVMSALEIWSKRGAMAIVQMLPKWLWKRTALGRASEVRLQGLIPGAFNQKLIAKEVSLWDELEEDRGIKVPVFTLEQDKVATWAQMLAGRGSIWTLGYVFKLDAASVNKESRLFNLDYDQLSAEQRVQAFRVTASPMARKLAGLLAAAPVITLPIVRLIRETLLKDCQQVHVAEVFLGGLLKPLSEINAETNPDYVQYDFMEGVRELLLDSVPSEYVLNVVDEVSSYVAKKAGLSLDAFAGVLRKERDIKDIDIASNIAHFATVTAQILRQLGGEYAKFADLIGDDFEQNSYLLWQQDKTKIYSICTDKPWTLPFDALVIPMGYSVFVNNRLLSGGGFGIAFQSFLGKNLILFSEAVAIALGENKNQYEQVTPAKPLLVPLPSQINNLFYLLNTYKVNRFVILTTVEDPEVSISNASKAINSIITLAVDQGLRRIVLPLIGTGNIRLSVTQVANEMLSEINKTLNNLSFNPIEEIIFVDKSESIVKTINQVSSFLFNQENITTDKVELLSEKDIDYTQLRSLLEAGNWKEADRETARVMLQASGQEERGWLDEEDMKNLPSTDLQTIDQLWVRYSNGKFGFSVQKRIWKSIGGKDDYNNEVIGLFSELVGWRKEETWLNYSEITFDLNAPEGHLPVIGENGWWERPWEVYFLAQGLTNFDGDFVKNQPLKERENKTVQTITVNQTQINSQPEDKVNTRINALALESKQHSPKSVKRQIALTNLINAIKSSGKLYCRGKNNYPVELYEEALQETWLYVFRKIDDYKIEKTKFITWVNFILYHKFMNAVIQYEKQQKPKLSLDTSINSFEELEMATLLDRIVDLKEPLSTVEELIKLIEEDPKGIFTSKIFKKNPQANFRELLLRRIEGQTWQEISEDLNIPQIVALSSFYKRCIKEFENIFKQYLQE